MVTMEEVAIVSLEGMDVEESQALRYGWCGLVS